MDSTTEPDVIIHAYSTFIHIPLARAWRLKHGYTQSGGVVIIFYGAAVGWVPTLRNPEHWEPGAIAIDESGNTWVAIGGGVAHGATHWMPTTTVAWRRQNIGGKQKS